MRLHDLSAIVTVRNHLNMLMQNRNIVDKNKMQDISKKLSEFDKVFVDGVLELDLERELAPFDIDQMKELVKKHIEQDEPTKDPNRITFELDPKKEQAKKEKKKKSKKTSKKSVVKREGAVIESAVLKSDDPIAAALDAVGAEEDNESSDDSAVDDVDENLQAISKRLAEEKAKMKKK